MIYMTDVQLALICNLTAVTIFMLTILYHMIEAALPDWPLDDSPFYDNCHRHSDDDDGLADWSRTRSLDEKVRPSWQVFLSLMRSQVATNLNVPL